MIYTLEGSYTRLMSKPNILFIMTDQQRFDTIRALGNEHIYTPNLDRLAQRGLAFTNAYSTCPVCVAARYTTRTGCEPPTTRVFSNGIGAPAPGQAATITARATRNAPVTCTVSALQPLIIVTRPTRPRAPAPVKKHPWQTR